MNRSVGISVGIGIAAVLVIIAFTNVDDLVSTNIEDTTSQISKSLEKATSEVEFSNPLQTYNVNTVCELAYLIQDNLENNQGSPFKVDREYVESLMVEWEEDAKKMNEEFGDAMRLDPELMKEKNLEFFEQGRQEVLDHAMEYNSIHPKLRDSVELVSTKAFTAETYQEKITVLNTMYLIEPEPYRDDPQCGKKFHERFGNETFKTLKQIFGEERAVSDYNNLKKIIYEN